MRHASHEGVFVSYCPALDIRSQGRTEEEARRALESAVTLFLSTCLERGILERELERAGLRPPESTPDPDQEFIGLRQFEEESELDFDFEIPLSLVAQAQAQRPSA